MTTVRSLLTLMILLALAGEPAIGQESARALPLAHGTSAVEPLVDEASLQGLRFREVGPYRGGRVTAVDGVPDRPFTYFMGATGGGVWRTDNNGHDWRNVSDGFVAHGAIGAIEVADADPNVIYVGTGSSCIRGNISVGVGMYRSRDMGDTWQFIGLPRAGQIGRVLTHPGDADLVYAAALGNPFGANDERGVYRSRNGGDDWEQVLFVSDTVGAVDLAMDPNNPRVLYAAMWHGERKPWSMISGSEAGGLFKSTDSGDSWTELGGGFPEGLVGRIGVAVSPVDSDRVWAMVEADDDRTGLYRSDDAGASWQLISRQGGIASRPWYYMHVVADPTDRNTVYALNSGFYRSIDGGSTFESISMPHSDHHDMWIDPSNPDVLFVGNDGGATLSVDGGESWSLQLNQPTAEIYSLTVDSAYPYRLYGPQQDNSTISLPSQATHSGITMQHWLSVGGCETGPIAIKPDDPDIFYAGCFGGRLARYDRTSEQFRQIRPYPEENAGMPESELRYRIQWNAPITASRHDLDVLYHGSQYVHRSRDEGQSWQVISPDLTGEHTEVFGPAGGPITHDITGVEMYSALLAIEEDHYDRDVIWAGSNDGVVSISRDAGLTWSNVTPPELPELSTVNRIEPSPHRAGTATVATYRYRVDDWAPYVFRTTDFGTSWTRIADGTRGIPPEYPVRAVREDPWHEGILYAGTEFGLYWSTDAGARWQSLQLNLPRTPITDLRLVQNDLVVSTQGRGFWILDGVSVLHEMAAGFEEPVTLFSPADHVRNGSSVSTRDYPRDHVYGAMLPRAWMGENPPDGVILDYWIEEAPPGEITLSILEPEGNVLWSRSSSDENDPLPTAAGVNRVVWDLQAIDSSLPGRFGRTGPRAAPGLYVASLTVEEPAGTTRVEREFEVHIDPRLRGVTVADLQAQFDYLSRVRDDVARLQRTLEQVRSVREQIADLQPKLKGLERKEDLRESSRLISEELDAIEDGLVQTGGSGWANQPRVQRNLSWLHGAASTQRGERTDARPTDQLIERLNDVEAMLDEQVAAFEMLVDHDLDDLNLTIMDLGVPAILIEESARR